MRRWSRGTLALAAALVTLAGCGSGDETSGSSGSGGAGGAGGDGGVTQPPNEGGTGGTGCEGLTEPPAPSSDWCARLVGGPKSSGSAAVGWSAAHALARFFGPVK